MRTSAAENVLLTGAGSGMGRAAALALGGGGLMVLAADMDLAKAQETSDMIVQSGGRSAAFRVDVSQSRQVAGLFQELRLKIDRLDLLVHTAAILGRTAFIEDITDEEWRRMTAVNLDGAFYCCREAVRWMKEAGGGRIILFSSVASLTPTPGAIAYSASKAAVNMLAKSLAVEAAKHNVRVNVIAPGYVETPMLAGLPEGFKDYILRRTPLQRLGQVEEIAALVTFLSSNEADFFTGQVLSPNGGLVI
ncbi:MAG: SDR family NAD(P)-dependent oxidoreductase [Pseudomonadota bacterium]